MADVIDDANSQRDRLLEMQISAARYRAAQPVVASDECLNECGDAPASGSRWCSADCRNEYETRAEIRRRQGLK